MDAGKHDLLGVTIDAVDYEESIRRVLAAAQEGQPLATSALAVHGVMTGALDREHRSRLNHLDMVVPDGQPVRWALNWLHGVCLSDRVYGPELMLRTCYAAEEAGVPIYLFGSSEEILTDLRASLTERMPKLQIAGSRPSHFRAISPEEQDQLAADIVASGAKIAFIGLGCPRQEIFAYHMRDRLPMPTLAVGAAFAFHAGRLSQAPSWMQSRGLEWLFRLLAEPKRLWRRYLVLNPLYLTLVASQLLKLHRKDKGIDPPPAPDYCPG